MGVRPNGTSIRTKKSTNHHKEVTMQIRNGEPPGIDVTFTRRAALGGMLAAILTPALLAGGVESPAWAQQAPPPVVTPIPRTGHTTTMLGDGSVHIAGGTYLG